MRQEGSLNILFFHVIGGINVHISNEIVAEISPELLHYCEKNLTLNNPDYEKKQQLGLWLGNTPKKIQLYRISGDRIIIPAGLRAEIKQFSSSYCTNFPCENIQISRKQELKLYDYQEKAVEQMLSSGYGVLESRAGSGKTIMGIELIKRLGKKTLWLTHTGDLLTQSKTRFKQYFDANIGEITAGKCNIQDVTFATVQTLSRMDLNAIRNEFSVIIIDESHRVFLNPSSASMFGKVINNLNAEHKYGLSATCHRSDSLISTMFMLIGPIQHRVPESATAKRTISATIQPIYTEFELSDFSECIDTDGTIIFSKMITEISEDADRNQQIVKDIKKENKCSLILSDRISQLQSIRDRVGYGVLIDGKTKKSVREQAIQDVRDGKEKVLYASYGLAKEGLDIPRLERLFLATPKKDYAVIVQSVGRIERTFEGKNQPVVFDYIDQIGMCKNMFRQRCRHYRQNKNKIEEEV